jgi:hypothetical protein
MWFGGEKNRGREKGRKFERKRKKEIGKGK